MNAVVQFTGIKKSSSSQQNSNQVIKSLITNELIFAVVGPAGSGTSWVADALAAQIKNYKSNAEIHRIKASTSIKRWADKNEQEINSGKRLNIAISYQDVGDEIRKKDSAGVAVEIITDIKEKRDSVDKTDKFNIFIIDSLKHPAEVALLRSVYQDAFCLIGVVCSEDERINRLTTQKYPDSSREEVLKFAERDEDSGESNGQKVSDTFHLADFFVNNTPPRYLIESKSKRSSPSDAKRPNPNWDVNEQLGRLFDLLTHDKLLRPTPSETGMFHAYGAQMRSACLSRQVGAALLDKNGNLLSTGTNEVPRAGGGVYGSVFSDFDGHSIINDHRCSAVNGYCSNTKITEEIFKELKETLPELKETDATYLKQKLKKTSIGRLIEFSRAVHAEMDSLLTASRQGSSPVGGKLFVTTFPCHYCARHIIASGVDEVQYIEPYPKSRALSLHGDAIIQNYEGWTPPSESKPKDELKVLFRPFTGVAPRMYRRLFLKDRPLKNSSGDMHFGEPEWASGLLKNSYQEVENSLITNRTTS